VKRGDTAIVPALNFFQPGLDTISAVSGKPETAFFWLAGTGAVVRLSAIAVLGVVDGSLENQAFLARVSLRPPGWIQAAAGGLWQVGERGVLRVVGVNGGEGQEGEVEGVALLVDEVAELAGGEGLGFALKLGTVADGVVEEHMVNATVDMVKVLDVAGRGVDGFVEGDGAAVLGGLNLLQKRSVSYGFCPERK